MSELHLTIDGYVREVGDLGLGRKGPSGRGITIEMADGTDDVVITGLTVNQCRAAAHDIGKKIVIDIRTVSTGVHIEE